MLAGSCQWHQHGKRRGTLSYRALGYQYAPTRGARGALTYRALSYQCAPTRGAGCTLSYRARSYQCAPTREARHSTKEATEDDSRTTNNISKLKSQNPPKNKSENIPKNMLKKKETVVPPAHIFPLKTQTKSHTVQKIFPKDSKKGQLYLRIHMCIFILPRHSCTRRIYK